MRISKDVLWIVGIITGVTMWTFLVLSIDGAMERMQDATIEAMKKRMIK